MLNPDKTSANIAIVQNCYALFGRGDITGILNQVTPDIVWETVGRPSDFPLLGTYSGREGVGRFFSSLAATEDFTDFSPQQFHGSGDKVFVTGHYEMTMKASGKHAAMDWVMIFTLRDGMVCGFREHTDTAQLAATYRT